MLLGTENVSLLERCPHRGVPLYLIISVFVRPTKHRYYVSLLDTQLLVLVLVRGVGDRVIPKQNSHSPCGVDGQRVSSVLGRGTREGVWGQ